MKLLYRCLIGFLIFSGNLFAEDIKPVIDLSKYLFEEIRIWGLSEDGKIAYTSERPYRGGAVEFIIYDIVEKKLLWDSPVDISLNENSQYYIRLHGEEDYNNWKNDLIEGFKKRMKDYNIQDVDIEFKNFPIIFDKKEFYCNLMLSYNKYYPNNKIDYYNIVINENIVARIEPILDVATVTMCGYFVDTIGDNIIIIALETTTTNDPHYKFIKLQIK